MSKDNFEQYVISEFKVDNQTAIEMLRENELIMYALNVQFPLSFNLTGFSRDSIQFKVSYEFL